MTPVLNVEEDDPLSIVTGQQTPHLGNECGQVPTVERARTHRTNAACRRAQVEIIHGIGTGENFTDHAGVFAAA